MNINNSSILKNSYIFNTEETDVNFKYKFKKKTIREVSPYMTEEEVYHMRMVERKNKRINTKDFDIYPCQKQIKERLKYDFVITDPSENPLHHLYRKIQKKKWMDKHNFIVA